MARGRPRRVTKDIPAVGKKLGGANLEDFANGKRLDIGRSKGNPANAAASRAKLARQEVAKLKEQKKQLVKDLAETRKEPQAREDERFLKRQDKSMLGTQEAYNAQKKRRSDAAKKGAFTRELNRIIADVKARKAAKEAAEQEAKHQAEVSAKRQAAAAELKAAHDNYISMRRNDAIIFADEAEIPAREFLESADDSAIEFWALSTRPKPSGFETAQLERLRGKIDPQNLAKLDLLVKRYKEFAEKRAGANWLNALPQDADKTVTSKLPAIDAKAWTQSLGKMVDNGMAIGGFLWDWGLKKPTGALVRTPRRALAVGAAAGAGALGYSHYRDKKRGTKAEQDAANIKANMEQARRGFEDFIAGPDTGLSYDKDGDATLPWINELSDNATAEQAATKLITEIDDIQNQMGRRYGGFSSGAVGEETLRKVQNLWTVYNSAGERTNANRWRNIKEVLATRHPKYYTLLAGDPKEQSKEQAKIFHEIDDIVNAQARGGK